MFNEIFIKFLNKFYRYLKKFVKFNKKFNKKCKNLTWTKNVIKFLEVI